MTKTSVKKITNNRKRKKKRLRSLIIILVVFVLVWLTLSILIACNTSFIIIILFSIPLIALCFCAFFKIKHKQAKTRNEVFSGEPNTKFLTTCFYKIAPELFRDLAWGYVLMAVATVLIIFLNHKTIIVTQTTHEALEHMAEDPADTIKFLKLLFYNDYLNNNSAHEEFATGKSISTTSAVTTAKNDTSAKNASNNLSDDKSEPKTDVINSSVETDDDVIASNSNSNTTAELDNNTQLPSSNINSINEEADKIQPLILAPYDFSPLYFWGSHEFGNSITGEDITNMQNKYDDFLDNKVYASMLELPEDTYGNYQDILDEIKRFDENQLANGQLVTSEELYCNAMNRLFCYKKKGDVKNLEQSAISAEGAIEKEDIAVSGSYNNYIKYTKTTVINFLCVLDSDSQEYESGSEADIKFRIAKALYKPSANLLSITSDEKYYSICSAYLVSKDAYNLSNSECKYAVDIAFYHLKICSDIASYMESGTSRDQICWEALGVYAELTSRIEESDKAIYSTYQTESEQLLEKINLLLNEDVEREIYAE